jgi:hypothetical protein
LKNKTILDICIFPPETSYICFTIFKHIYSISEDKIGDAIESVVDKCSGPSKVTNRSSIGTFVFFRSLLFVFLERRQNCGLHDTFIIEFRDDLGSTNF